MVFLRNKSTEVKDRPRHTNYTYYQKLTISFTIRTELYHLINRKDTRELIHYVIKVNTVRSRRMGRIGQK